jgi:hypothetical protein
MGLAGLLLIVGGIAAIAIGALKVRGPLATIRHLDATEANLARYETWRGKQTGVQAEGPTGADIMRAQMRQRVLLWGGLIGVGIVAIVLGLVLG